MAVSLHPLFTTEKIDGVIEYFPVAERSQLLAPYMPLTNVNSDKIILDVDKVRRGGMTPMVAPGSESPIYGVEGRGRIEWYPAEFREKVLVTEPELIDQRRLGTLDQLEGAADRIRWKFRQIEDRLARRIEWMRRQVLFDNQVVAYDEMGVQFQVDYSHPSYLEPSAATAWTTTATADPLNDLQLWAEDYMDKTGFMIRQVIVPQGTYRTMLNTDRLKDMQTNSFGGFNGSHEQVAALMQMFLGVGNVMESTHRIEMTAELTAASPNGDTTLNLSNVNELEVGSKIYINSHTDMEKEELEVASIAGNVVTVTSGVVRTAGYVSGDQVKWSVKTVPAGKILMIGAPMVPLNDEGQVVTHDASKLQQWGEVVSTYSRYENLSPRAGIFRKNINRLDDDPPRLEQVIGIRALPIVYYNEGWQVCDYL